MVEELKEQMDGMGLEDMPASDEMLRNINNPKYLETAEKEIDKMFVNAKVALTQLGFDLDKERLDNIDSELPEEIDETELERLLAGGLPYCKIEKDCGHKCGGVKDEGECLPCLEPECIQGTNLPQKDELCGICYTCELHEEPGVQLSCGHIFHANCVVELLKHKWASLRITFSFMSCPQCKAPIEVDHVESIADEIDKLTVLRSELQVKAMKIAKS